MKKILVAFILSSLFIGQVMAATTPPTPTPADPTPTTESKAKLDDLKERLATKVAQLRQTQRKAIFGKVKSTTVSTVTVETKTSDVKIELTDDIKVFQMIKGIRTALTTEEVSKDDTVVVFGDYDASLDLLKAKLIFIQSTLPVRISGRVTEIDKKAFTINMTTLEGQTYIVDVEKNTANMMWDKEAGVVKGGFSKIEVGSTIHVVGSLEPKEDNRMSALRILDIGNLSGATPTPTPTEEATPSATPTTKTTPKATPKPTVKSTPTPTT